MADKSSIIRTLRRAGDILVPGAKIAKENASQKDIVDLNKALKFYSGYFEAVIHDRKFDEKMDPFDMDWGTIRLIIEYLQKGEEEAEQKKPKEQEASIPPELESLVAEYRQNQALLESEEIKSNSQKSVAAQVKIAIAHSKIKELALANHERRDTALVTLGSPKSGSVTEALAVSYYVTKKIALTYGGFSKLSPELQKEIITSAVELNLVGVSDINAAIQAASLQVDISNLSDSDKDNLATIPGGFVSTIYQEVVALDKQEIEYQEQISANEERIIDLEKQEKIEEARLLTEENLHLLASIEGQSAHFTDKATKLTESFKNFEKKREEKYSQIEETNRDFRDKITSANSTIASIHSNLKANGVKSHLYTPMDDVNLLEDAIRHDILGTLRQYSGYKAEYAAALISNPKTQDPNLSPSAILLYGKELTPTLLAQARRFAKANPGSALGKLFQTRRDIFDTAGSQIRKISQSPLGKEILKPVTGIGKILKPVSSFFGKISDKIGSFSRVLGTASRVIQNPWGTFKSWIGRRVGKIVVNKIINSAAGKIAIEAGKKLAGELLKKGIGRAIVNISTKLGIKASVALGLSSTVVGAPVALILVVVDVAVGVLKLGWKAIQGVATSLYGEKIKSRDLLAVPVAGVATAVGGVIAFFGALGTATVAAAGSAFAITVTGVLIGIFFYITSIVMAPLISTLVQLDSIPLSGQVNSCANVQGIFVSQRDHQWSNTFCSNCNSSGSCSIGLSGCGTAAATIILKSFGLDNGIVNYWNDQHSSSGYEYYDQKGIPTSISPYMGCGSRWGGVTNLLSDNGLAITSIGTNLTEADSVILNCGLILSAGKLSCSAPGGWCGHFLVIVSHSGNQITTMDPWNGENYVHTIDSTYKITHMWAVVP